MDGWVGGLASGGGGECRQTRVEMTFVQPSEGCYAKRGGCGWATRTTYSIHIYTYLRITTRRYILLRLLHYTWGWYVFIRDHTRSLVGWLVRLVCIFTLDPSKSIKSVHCSPSLQLLSASMATVVIHYFHFASLKQTKLYSEAPFSSALPPLEWK